MNEGRHISQWEITHLDVQPHGIQGRQVIEDGPHQPHQVDRREVDVAAVSVKHLPNSSESLDFFSLECCFKKLDNSKTLEFTLSLVYDEEEEDGSPQPQSRTEHLSTHGHTQTA